MPVVRNLSKDIVYGYIQATVIGIRATCVFCLRVTHTVQNSTKLESISKLVLLCPSGL